MQNKPRYRIKFFENGDPKSASGPQYFYLYINNRFWRGGLNFDIMATKEVREIECYSPMRKYYATDN